MLNGKHSLAFKLVEAGFDVWLNNTRGNRFSHDHQFLDIKHPDNDMQSDLINPNVEVNRAQYFDYSYHEMGIYDLPALIKMVVETSGQRSVNYIGHSQGTT